MWRRFAVGLGAGLVFAITLLATGCGNDGAYTVSWQFYVSVEAAAAGGPTEAAASGCGAHGVDAVLVTAVSSDGSRHQTDGICAHGTLTHGIAIGQWQFTLSQVDVLGNQIPAPDGTPDPQFSGQVAEGQVLEADVVTLAPRPACADGIDNDRDGRIDLDDPDCVDAAWDSEASAAAAP